MADGEGLIVLNRRIKGPGPVGVDAQTGNRFADECIGGCGTGISVGGGEETGDDGGVFCGGLCRGEGSDRRVIGAGDGDDKGFGVAGGLVISDGVIDGDDLRGPSSEGLIGRIGGVKGPGTIGVDGQASNRFANQSKGSGGTSIRVNRSKRAVKKNAIFYC